MAKKARFTTDRQVATLQPIDGKRTDYHHGTEGGLILRVSTRNRTWVVDHVVKDGDRVKRRKKSIGAYPDLSLADALKQAREIKADAGKGVDLIGEKEARNEAPTVSDVLEFYFKVTKMAEKSMEEGRRMFEKDIDPELGELKAMDLRRSDVKRLHQQICDRGAPTMANRVIELMRRAFNVAHEEELIPINTFPAIRKIKAKETPRERILKDAEIKALWTALDGETDNARDIMRLLLLLGQRSTETMSMAIADLDVEKRIWTVPPERTKNSKPNVLQIPDLAWSIIEPRLKNEKWIFPTKYNRTRAGAKNTGHTKTTKDVRRRLRKATGITGWTAHDLRRTCRTLMARERVRPDIAEMVIGHVQPGIQQIYDQHGYLDEKGEALRKVERVIRRIVGLETESAKVIRLAGGA